MPQHFPNEGWYRYCEEILKARGFDHGGTFTFDRPGKPRRLWSELASLSPGIDGLYICEGESPREYVTEGHACIFDGTGKLVHDPHPSRAGLLTVEHAMMIEPNKHA
jgi:hypothetical protein